jgi:hypothetical protein
LFGIEHVIEIDTGNILGLEVNVGIASYITSLSRIALYQYKKYCIDNGIKVFYFDTDLHSIVQLFS